MLTPRQQLILDDLIGTLPQPSQANGAARTVVEYFRSRNGHQPRRLPEPSASHQQGDAPRSIPVLGEANTSQPDPAHTAALASIPASTQPSLPLLGDIPAGSPTNYDYGDPGRRPRRDFRQAARERHEARYASEVDTCSTVDVDSLSLPSGRRCFALRVRGDSMVGAHILDGDFVVMEFKPPHHGAIVAALIDGETTLKRYLLRGARPFLRAENPAYPELIPAHELVVQGVMVALLRNT